MSDVRDPETDQALPIPNDRPSIHDLVAADLAARKAHGLRKYGSLLQAGNGRSFLLDLYEELLDACCYVRGRLEEEREAIAPVRAAEEWMRAPRLRCSDGRGHDPHCWDTLPGPGDRVLRFACDGE